jgi:flagellin-specific chaperone FliS
MEDVYDCLPLEELKEFYDFFISRLVKLNIICNRTDNITILKVCNNMMKRLSKGTFNELRGK